jgi:hypothetical protein
MPRDYKELLDRMYSTWRDVEVADCALSKLLQRAIRLQEHGAVTYLLWAGVSPRVYADAFSVLQLALKNGDVRMAQILRNHHASLIPSPRVPLPYVHPFSFGPVAPKSVEDAASLMRKWLIHTGADFPLANTDKMLQWLETAPLGVHSVPSYHHKRLLSRSVLWHYKYSGVTPGSDNPWGPLYVEFEKEHVHVNTTWPPHGMVQWPPASALASGILDASTHFRILDYWMRVRKLRRAEAAVSSKRHWLTLRKFVLHVRPIGFYWFGLLQEKSCAREGVGRKRDLDAYKGDGF